MTTLICLKPTTHQPVPSAATLQSQSRLPTSASQPLERKKNRALLVSMDSAKESLDLAYQVSQILGTGLDRHTLSLLISLCDRGVNPKALSALVREFSSSAPAPSGPPAGGNKISGNGSAPFVPSSAPSSFRSNLR
ncbi:Mitotic-spindle organizing protein 1 [Rhynchospora pubera]|uniref:Mitotic-spindle organizing protein 1 n=1 Tax=Rhynchospora pubera TaxID=906938 RepID=A0AAV8FFB4_9POAL|nr:Mitotic-spindle organizing protein 1 [Rhynchospora pubera]